LNTTIDGSAATAAAATEAFDPAGATDAGTRETNALFPEPRPAAGSSSSAVLPGGTAVSAVESSGGRGPFFRSVAQIGRQVAQGLAYAHSRGIVHRDIKPSNLLLDTAGVVWITDFGLAKAEDDGLTATGDILGTLRYMAPERFRGEGDARADIYALGISLYELVALRPAYEVNDRLKLVERIKNEDPARPRDLDPRIPRDLETVILKAIEKDPGARYQTAESLSEDLGRFLADEPIQARQVSATERYWRWARRNPVIATLGAVLSAVLSVGFVVMALLWSRAERSAGIARANELTAQTLANQEAKARGEAQTQERIALEKAELLAREDYVNRVNRAYREVQDGNIALAEDLLHGCDPKRRGWEWRFVERLCNSERQVIVGVGNLSVNALACSPDGTWAVSGAGAPIVNGSSATTPIDVWDVGSGRRLKTLPGSKGTVYTVEVSPDGKRAAAGFSDGLVIVWDVAAGQVAWTRNDPGLNAMSVAFSPDGKSLAVGYGAYSGDQVGRVKLWDVATGNELQAFTGPKGGVNKVAFHPDGQRLAVAGSEVVEVWDPKAIRKLGELKSHKKWVYCLAYSPDGKWLASGGWDNTIKLSDAATGALSQTIFAHEGFVVDLAFSPDSRKLVTASEDRSVRLWEIPSGRRVGTFHGHSDFVQAVVFRPDGREIGTGSMDGSIRFWDLERSRPVVLEHSGWVTRLAFRRDGLRVISEAGFRATDSQPTKVWNPITGEVDQALAVINFESLPADYVRGPLGFLERFYSRHPDVTSPDGKLIAKSGDLTREGFGSRSKDYTYSSVVVRETETGKVLHTLTGHSADVTSLAFSPDARRLATASFDRTVKLWDMQTGQEVFTLIGHTSGVVVVAFSPDGNQIVSGGIDQTARVWNATPLASGVTAEHDARYRKKIETLTQLKAATDDAERGNILAGSGQWGMAAGAFARAVEKEPDRPELRFQLIEALLYSADRSEVEHACDAMVKRFGETGNPLRTAATLFHRLARMAITDPGKRQAVHEIATAKDDNERLSILAKHGRWDVISQAMAKVVDDQTYNLEAQNLYLLSLVGSGDIQGYRSAAEKLLSRSRKSSDANKLNNAAWQCTYAPNAVADLEIPVQMAEAAVAGYPPEQKRFALNTLGAALYRAGRIDEALTRLDESVKASGGTGVPQDWVFLAMAHHKKGHREETRHWLEKVRAQAADGTIAFSSNSVEIQILLRELEEVIRSDSSTRR
jgi:WD40 repeat protein